MYNNTRNVHRNLFLLLPIHDSLADGAGGAGGAGGAAAVFAVMLCFFFLSLMLPRALLIYTRTHTHTLIHTHNFCLYSHFCTCGFAFKKLQPVYKKEEEHNTASAIDKDIKNQYVFILIGSANV